MKIAQRENHRCDVSKRRQQHYSYDESVVESTKLIEDESVEIDRETPAKCLLGRSSGSVVWFLDASRRRRQKHSV